MSTFYHDVNIDSETLTKDKPELEIFNNKTKGRVDVFNEL